MTLRPPRRRHVFAAPAAIAATSLTALVTGLLGDGWHDVVMWIGLGAVLAVMLRSLVAGPR